MVKLFLLGSKINTKFINNEVGVVTTMKKITIDLGKGVELKAPVKMHMTKEEWLRMVEYINEHIKR